MMTFTSRYELSDTITVLQNIIIWADGTVRPWRGHNNCSGVWRFDGQFYVHQCKS